VNETNHQQTVTRTPARPAPGAREELLDGLKGKGPREVLGAIAPTRLGWAMLQATVGCLLLMAVLTVGPYLLAKHPSGDAKAAKPADKTDDASPAKIEPAPDPAASKKTTEKPETKPSAAESKKDQGKPPKDILDKLKENDVKKDKPKDPFGTSKDDDLPGLKDK